MRVTLVVSADLLAWLYIRVIHQVLSSGSESQRYGALWLPRRCASEGLLKGRGEMMSALRVNQVICPVLAIPPSSFTYSTAGRSAVVN